MEQAYKYDDQLIGIGEAARIAQVTKATLRRWDREGLLPSVRTPGGQRRYRRGDIERLYEQKPAAS